MAAFQLRRQRSIVATKPVWPEKSEIFTMYHFQEQSVQPSSKAMVSPLCTGILWRIFLNTDWLCLSPQRFYPTDLRNNLGIKVFQRCHHPHDSDVQPELRNHCCGYPEAEVFRSPEGNIPHHVSVPCGNELKATISIYLSVSTKKSYHSVT